jgi:hypothetical protein
MKWWALACSLLCWSCAHAELSRAPLPSDIAPPNWRAGADLLTLRMQAVAQELDRDGFADSGIFARGFLPPGERRTERVTLPPETCLRWVALGSAGITDLDAALYTQDGSLAIDDDNADARPTLTACTGAAAQTVYLRLLSYQGGGAFLAVMFMRQARAEDVAHVLPSPTNDDAFGELARTLSKRGFVDRADVVELSLSAEEELRIALPAEAGRCYAVLVAPSGGLEELSLRVLDTVGHELANGLAESAPAGIQWCSRETSEASMLLRATRGAGMARMMRFVGPEETVGGPSALWLGEPSPSRAAWTAQKAKQPATAPGARRNKPVAFSGSLSQGHLLDFSAPPLAGAACEQWTAELGPGVSRAALALIDETGRVLGQAEARAPRVTLRVCGRTTRAHVTIVSRAGFGPFELNVNAARRE